MVYISCRTCKNSYVFGEENGSVHYKCSITHGINCINKKCFYYEPKYKIETPKEFITKDEMNI